MVNSSDVSSLQRNRCDCQCGVLAAELEGVKLGLVILQKSVEIKIIEVKSHEDLNSTKFCFPVVRFLHVCART